LGARRDSRANARRIPSLSKNKKREILRKKTLKSHAKKKGGLKTK